MSKNPLFAPGRLTRAELIEKLRLLIEGQDACNGDYDLLYFGLKDLIDREAIE
mgnify:CR=1 FL=1